MAGSRRFAGIPAATERGDGMTDVRGNPWEHDPGPPGPSGWAELFAATPNYRGLGQAVLGREALAMGPVARRLAPKVAPASLDVINLGAPGEPGFRASWQAALTQLAGRRYPRDLTKPTFTAPTTRGQLPRIDLPYGTVRWAGTSGDRAVRPVDTGLGEPSPDYLKVFLPAWAANLEPAPLTAAEQLAAKELS